MWRLVPMGVVCLLGALLGSGCSSHVHHLKDVRNAYFAGDLATARAKIDEAVTKHPREAEVFELEQGSVLLSEGKVKEAEQVFRRVRDRLDHLEQKDAAELALSMLTDDQQLAYAGEDYEKILVRVYLAFANLLGDGQDASAYALQVTSKQDEIIQKGTGPDGKNPKTAYQRVAAGAYLQAMLREATHQNYDDAARSLERVCHWAPEFRHGQLDLERVRKGRHSSPGHGVLYVFALVGRGPYKEERAEIATQAGLLIADRILSATGKHTLPPTIAPVKVPRVVCPVNHVASVAVQVDGKALGQTETLTDVGRLAVQQAEAVFPQVLGRAIARRVVKKAAVYGVKEALPTHAEAQLTSIVLDVAGVVWEATEAADTRCWGLLPDKIQVLRLELPAGTHRLALTPIAATGAAQGEPASTTIEVADGRSHCALVSMPTGKVVGSILTSRTGR